MQHEHADHERTEQLEVDVEEHVEATPEEIFDYLADGAQLPDTEDGTLTFSDRVTSERPHRIGWRVEFEDERGAFPGTVDVTLTPDATGTRVRVVHRSDMQPRMMALAA